MPLSSTTAARTRWLECSTMLMLNSVLAECERVDLNARLLEGDLERPVAYVTALPNQLIQALAGHHALPVGTGIDAVCRARCRAVESYPEAHGFAIGSREHQMKI